MNEREGERASATRGWLADGWMHDPHPNTSRQTGCSIDQTTTRHASHRAVRAPRVRVWVWVWTSIDSPTTANTATAVALTACPRRR